MAELLNKLQINQLRKMVQSNDGWDVLVLAYGNYIDELNAQPVSGKDAFETLRDLHRKEGKVDGLKEFFEKIERLDLQRE